MVLPYYSNPQFMNVLFTCDVSKRQTAIYKLQLRCLTSGCAPNLFYLLASLFTFHLQMRGCVCGSACLSLSVKRSPYLCAHSSLCTGSNLACASHTCLIQAQSYSSHHYKCDPFFPYFGDKLSQMPLYKLCMRGFYSFLRLQFHR